MPLCGYPSIPFSIPDGKADDSSTFFMPRVPIICHGDFQDKSGSPIPRPVSAYKVVSEMSRILLAPGVGICIEFVIPVTVDRYSGNGSEIGQFKWTGVHDGCGVVRCQSCCSSSKWYGQDGPDALQMSRLDPTKPQILSLSIPVTILGLNIVAQCLKTHIFRLLVRVRVRLGLACLVRWLGLGKNYVKAIACSRSIDVSSTD